MKRVGVVLLSAWLWALPAAAEESKVALCEADCDNNTGVTMRACMETCPATDNPKNHVFLKCATKCSTQFNTQIDACKARCGGKPAEKKSKSQPIRKHTHGED